MSSSSLTSLIVQPQPNSKGNEKLLPSLNLPRELRDKIYHELWTSRPYHGTDAGRPNSDYIYAYYTRPHDRDAIHPSYFRKKFRPTLPTWLLTSRATLREGLAQYQRHADWHLDVGASEHFDFGLQRLLNPFEAQMMCISGLDCVYVPPTSWSLSPSWEEVSTTFLDRIVNHLASAPNNNITNLTLDASVWDEDLLDDEAKCVELAPWRRLCAALPKLQVLTVSLHHELDWYMCEGRENDVLEEFARDVFGEGVRLEGVLYYGREWHYRWLRPGRGA